MSDEQGAQQRRSVRGTGGARSGQRTRRAPARSGDALGTVPLNLDELHAWVARELDVHVARSTMIDGHSAPMDYLGHTFFEGTKTGERGGTEEGADRAALSAKGADCVVWASRGGGKTFLGAVATLLDMVFKPGIQVRILGGSLEQSQRMHEHLRRFLERPALRELIEGKPTIRKIELINGSQVEVLAASQTSIRGTRVQKVRCDEVDLFDPEVWSAAQLTTRSMACVGPWGLRVRGTVEALSTMHRPYGLMWDLVGARRLMMMPTVRGAVVKRSRGAERVGERVGASRAVFRWGVLDVLETCPAEAECSTCVLWPECQGRAKAIRAGTAGHVSIEDASVMKARVDHLTWSAEMLCQRPRRTDAVYPEFEPEVHVYTSGPEEGDGSRWIAGMDFGFRSEAVVLLARVDRDGTLWVEREQAASGLKLEEHIRVMRGWIEDGHAGEKDGGVGRGGGGIEFVGVDPAGRMRSDQTGVSNVSVLRAAGFEVKSQPSGVHDGLGLVRGRLAPMGMARGGGAGCGDETSGLLSDSAGSAEESGWEGMGKPRLFVHARCERLIECLQRYHYPSERPESMEPVKDGFDHACDALRYMVLNLDRPGGGRVRVRRY